MITSEILVKVYTGNGLPHGQHQALTRTNAVWMPIVLLEKNQEKLESK